MNDIKTSGFVPVFNQQTDQVEKAIKEKGVGRGNVAGNGQVTFDKKTAGGGGSHGDLSLPDPKPTSPQDLNPFFTGEGTTQNFFALMENFLLLTADEENKEYKIGKEARTMAATSQVDRLNAQADKTREAGKEAAIGGYASAIGQGVSGVLTMGGGFDAENLTVETGDEQMSVTNTEDSPGLSQEMEPSGNAGMDAMDDDVEPAQDQNVQNGSEPPARARRLAAANQEEAEAPEETEQENTAKANKGTRAANEAEKQARMMKWQGAAAIFGAIGTLVKAIEDQQASDSTADGQKDAAAATGFQAKYKDFDDFASKTQQDREALFESVQKLIQLQAEIAKAATNV